MNSSEPRTQVYLGIDLTALPSSVLYNSDTGIIHRCCIQEQASYGQKHWTPPKGHVDPGEDDMTTALRETKEEAGLDKSDLKIMEKTWELSYPVKDWKDGIVRQKSTIYFLAELITGKA